MKTKAILLLCLPLLLYVACHEDDDGDNGQVVLTDDNFIYEGDLHTFYLERRLDTVQLVIDSLQTVIDNNQGDAKTQLELDHATQQKDTIVDGIASIPEGSFYLKVRPRPKGPCDPVVTCFPLPMNLEYLILVAQMDREVTILNAQNQIIGKSPTKAAPLLGYIDQFSYKSMNILQGQANDLVTIKVADLSTNTSYEVQAFLYQR